MADDEPMTPAKYAINAAKVSSWRNEVWFCTGDRCRGRLWGPSRQGLEAKKATSLLCDSVTRDMISKFHYLQKQKLNSWKVSSIEYKRCDMCGRSKRTRRHLRVAMKKGFMPAMDAFYESHLSIVMVFLSNFSLVIDTDCPHYIIFWLVYLEYQIYRLMLIRDSNSHTILSVVPKIPSFDACVYWKFHSSSLPSRLF